MKQVSERGWAVNKVSGFTLIEVLVASAILAIVAVMTTTSIENAIRLAESAEVEADRLQKISRVFDIMGRDFRQVIGRPVRNADGDDTEPAFSLNLAEQPMLKFSRAGWINPAPERFQRSELQRINYQFDGSKLVRYSWQMLDRYRDSAPQEVVLLENVKSFEVKVLSDVGTVNTSGQVVAADQGEWIDAWPLAGLGTTGSNLGTLPVAVEIIIDIEGWGRIRRVYELVSGVTL